MEHIIAILGQGIKETEIGSTDIRVTYSTKGVKIKIVFSAAYSTKQKKPFATFNEALVNALESYIENIEYRIANMHPALYYDNGVSYIKTLKQLRNNANVAIKEIQK